jgi:hypothetical protein
VASDPWRRGAFARAGGGVAIPLRDEAMRGAAPFTSPQGRLARARGSRGAARRVNVVVRFIGARGNVVGPRLAFASGSGAALLAGPHAGWPPTCLNATEPGYLGDGGLGSRGPAAGGDANRR